MIDKADLQKRHAGVESSVEGQLEKRDTSSEISLAG